MFVCLNLYGFVSSQTTHPATFSHVLCLHQSLYEIPDLLPFFQNVWYWLKPGGVFVVHLVQYDKKPPKVTIAMPAKMHYERTVNIESSSQSMMVYETFTDRITNHVRQQEQHLHYQNIDRVMNAAFYQGFRTNGKIEIKSPNVPRETREFIYFFNQIMKTSFTYFLTYFLTYFPLKFYVDGMMDTKRLNWKVHWTPRGLIAPHGRFHKSEVTFPHIFYTTNSVD